MGEGVKAEPGCCVSRRCVIASRRRCARNWAVRGLKSQCDRLSSPDNRADAPDRSVRHYSQPAQIARPNGADFSRTPSLCRVATAGCSDRVHRHPHMRSCTTLSSRACVLLLALLASAAGARKLEQCADVIVVGAGGATRRRPRLSCPPLRARPALALDLPCTGLALAYL